MFAGPDSLRVPSEHRRLVLTVIFLAPILAIVGIFFQNTFTFRSLVLLLIGAMVFVALSRGRLLGGGVRIGPGQFEHVYDIVVECSQLIGVPVPHIFVRDDPFVPIVAVGTGDPYSLVLSSQYIEAFSPDELRFLVGRELGHIAAGHAKLTSLLSVNGRENAFVAATFGAWLRIIEYTADRAGLLCCGSLTTAISAIAVSTFHHAGRKIDLHAFAEQRREIDAESMLRIGEWIGATPYATNRIARLGDFARDPLYLRWSGYIIERRAAPPVSAAPLTDDDPRRFAGFWRRFAAFCIDAFVVKFILPSNDADDADKINPVRIDIHGTPAPHASGAQILYGGHGINVIAAPVHVAPSTPDPATAAMRADMPVFIRTVVDFFTGHQAHIAIVNGFGSIIFAVYLLLLVGLMGQTLGMIILDLRVVCVGRERIGILSAFWRYVCLVASWCVLIGLLSTFARIQLFERWSRTRLVNGGAVRN